MFIDNAFQKKYIPSTTHARRLRNNNATNSNSYLKRTNSQIISNHNNIMDETNSIKTKSLKRTSSDDALYDEQIKYDMDSKKLIAMKNSTPSNQMNDSIQEDNSNSVPKKIEELLKFKNLCENTIKELETYKRKSKLNKTLSDKNNIKNDKSSNSNKSKESNSVISDNICNFNDIDNNLDINSKKKVSINFDFFKNKNSRKSNKFKDPKLSRYFKILRRDNLLNNNHTVSTNDFTKLKTKYFELKNEHDLTLSKLEKEKNKNKQQKEEIELLRNSIKYNSLNNNFKSNDDEANNIIQSLREQNETFRKELVLSQAMINSLKSELENKNDNDNDKNQLKNNNRKRKSKNNLYEDYVKNVNIDEHEKNIGSYSKNKFANYNNNEDGINTPKNNMKYDQLINKIEELNYSLNKKNEILNSILIENNKLRNELKSNKFNSSQKNMKRTNSVNNKRNKNNKNLISKQANSLYEFVDKIKYMFDLLYQDSLCLLNKYDQYKYSDINKYNNLILTEQFFNQLQSLKDKIYQYKDIKKFEVNNNYIQYYMELTKLITNEFDKLLLYISSLTNEKYFNDYENEIEDININNYYKNIHLNFEKEKNNLIDLCLLSTKYIEGNPKELILEGLNLIKSLGNLYEERTRLNGNENLNNNKMLIIKQEEQLEDIKNKLAIDNNINNYYYDYNRQNDNNKNFGLTYTTNYYTNNIGKRNGDENDKNYDNYYSYNA